MSTSRGRRRVRPAGPRRRGRTSRTRVSAHRDRDHLSGTDSRPEPTNRGSRRAPEVFKGQTRSASTTVPGDSVRPIWGSGWRRSAARPSVFAGASEVLAVSRPACRRAMLMGSSLSRPRCQAWPSGVAKRVCRDLTSPLDGVAWEAELDRGPVVGLVGGAAVVLVDPFWLVSRRRSHWRSGVGGWSSVGGFRRLFLSRRCCGSRRCRRGR